LAVHAEGGRAAALPPPERPRVLAHRRWQDVEVGRQRGGSAGAGRQVRQRRVPLLHHARDGVRPRRRLLRGSAGRAPQCRSRQRPRQPRVTRYDDARAPWELKKDPAKQPRLNAVLYTLAESLRCLGVVLAPFVPDAAAKIRSALGQTAEPTLADAVWGRLQAGARVQKISA